MSASPSQRHVQFSSSFFGENIKEGNSSIKLDHLLFSWKWKEWHRHFADLFFFFLGVFYLLCRLWGESVSVMYPRLGASRPYPNGVVAYNRVSLCRHAELTLVDRVRWRISPATTFDKFDSRTCDPVSTCATISAVAFYIFSFQSQLQRYRRPCSYFLLY